MRIFQAPVDIAGQMGWIHRGLENRGHTIHSYDVEKIYRGDEDHVVQMNRAELRRTFRRDRASYDVCHFHYGQSFTDNCEEFRYALEANKVRLMHYWGNDVRTEAQALEQNPYARLITQFTPESTIQKRLQQHSRWFPACIVQDYEVLPYVQGHFTRVYVLPLALHVEKLRPVFPGPSDNPLIVHTVTQPGFSGTAYVEETLQQLRDDGCAFQYVRIGKVTNKQALDEYTRADIVIDQVLGGSYGVLAVQAMALGKPVIAYIRPDLKSSFSNDLPVISANPATLYKQLRQLLDNQTSWAEIGAKGRAYVEQHHDSSFVAACLEQIYERERSLIEATITMLPTTSQLTRGRATKRRDTRAYPAKSHRDRRSDGNSQQGFAFTRG